MNHYLVHGSRNVKASVGYRCIAQLPTFYVDAINANNALRIASNVVNPDGTATFLSLSVYCDEKDDYSSLLIDEE